MTRYWTFINIREMYLTWVKTKSPKLDNISKVETIYFDQWAKVELKWNEMRITLWYQQWFFYLFSWIVQHKKFIFWLTWMTTYPSTCSQIISSKYVGLNFSQFLTNTFKHVSIQNSNITRHNLLNLFYTISVLGRAEASAYLSVQSSSANSILPSGHFNN